MNSEERLRITNINPEDIGSHALVSAGTFDNEIEEQLMVDILEESGIPYFLRLFDTSYLSDIYELVNGRSELFVPEQYHNEAMNLLEELRNSQPLEENMDEYGDPEKL